MQVIIVVAFGGSAALLGASVCLAQTFDVYCAFVPWLITGLWYNYVWMRNEPADTAKYLKFNCPKAEKLFAKVRCCGTSTDTTNNSVCLQSRIPISHLYEYYIDADVEFKGDVLVRIFVPGGSTLQYRSIQH